MSVLPSLNKIFEKILCVRIENFLSQRNFFFEGQFGYRKAMGTRNCVLEVLDNIYERMDEGDIVTNVFLDLSKAFDLVDHSLLFKKLEVYGLRGAVNDILRSYLTNRCQYVRIDNSDSSIKPKERGLPQGSCLGPLMYLIYTNDVSRLNILGNMSCFADDTSLRYPGKDILENCEKAERDLTTLRQYFAANGMKLNLSKTKVIHFHSRYKTGAEIERVTHFRYLGLELDNYLDFSIHVQSLCKKLRPWVTILFRLRNHLPISSLLNIYFSMIHSQITYLIEAWGVTAKKWWGLVQILQNQALRAIYFFLALTPRLQMFENAPSSIVPVKALYELSVEKFIFEAIRNLTISNLNFQTAIGSNASRNLHLQIPRTRTTIGDRRISVEGP